MRVSISFVNTCIFFLATAYFNDALPIPQETSDAAATTEQPSVANSTNFLGFDLSDLQAKAGSVIETFNKFYTAKEAGAPAPETSELVKKVGKAIGESSESGKGEDVAKAVKTTLDVMADDAYEKAQTKNANPAPSNQ